jgi:hypothetical protein
MQILSRNSSGKNNRSCSTFDQESIKIGFAFFWIFYDFIWIFQESTRHIYYLRCRFARNNLEVFDSLQIHPQFLDRPSERTEVSQCGPRGGGRRGRRNSGELQRRGRLGTGVGWSRGSLGSISTRGWGGGGASELPRRHRAAAAAVPRAPARWWLRGEGKQVGEL